MLRMRCGFKKLKSGILGFFLVAKGFYLSYAIIILLTCSQAQSLGDQVQVQVSGCSLVKISELSIRLCGQIHLRKYEMPATPDQQVRQGPESDDLEVKIPKQCTANAHDIFHPWDRVRRCLSMGRLRDSGAGERDCCELGIPCQHHWCFDRLPGSQDQ